MNPILLLTIFFLLFAFITNLSLTFSQDDEVVDYEGRPIFPYRKYYIVSTIFGGGLEFGKTNYSKCLTIVLQDYSEFVKGVHVKFSLPTKVSPDLIFTNWKLLIEFADKPDCVESSKWLVFVDNVTQKKFIGIGDPTNYHGVKILNGTFTIRNFKQYRTLYNIQFCPKQSQNCLDIGNGSYDKGEGGRPLILPAEKALEVAFVPAPLYEAGNY